MVSESLITAVRTRADKRKSHTLFGEIGGGQLEFVKLETFTKNDSDYESYLFVRIYFTNHDCEACPSSELYEGKYFVIEVPLNQ